jgi:hypothetical protein
MPQNRIFERPECRRRSLSASLTDVTKTARQWDAVFAMRVHPELLGKYTVPNVPMMMRDIIWWALWCRRSMLPSTAECRAGL